MKDHVALTRCFYCGEPNEILLATQYRRVGNSSQMEPVQNLAPFNNKVTNMRPCPKCEGYMKQGIIFITMDDAKSDEGWNKPPADPEERSHWMPNPYRTGGFFVVKEEAVLRFLNGEMLAFTLKHRWMFIEHEAAEKLGLFAAHAAAE